MDSICISMIIKIRNKLLKCDQNGCFTLLFKYPHSEKIKEIIILSYNIYIIMNERAKGKKIDPKIILNIVKSFGDTDNEDKFKNNSMNAPFSSSSSSSPSKSPFEDKSNVDNNNKNKEEINIKNNFLENKNIHPNSNNNYYQGNSFINDAISSIGKIGNKLKDQFKLAKEAVLGLEEYEDKNKAINNSKNDNKMSDLFDIPNFNKEKEKETNKTDINNNNDNQKDISNIIKRLKRIDNKYNKFFDEEDKKELGDIINELLKEKK